MWSQSQIEAAAEHIRREWGIPKGPLPNLVQLLEHRGVVIGRDYLADRELDGLSIWYDGRPYILLNTTKSPARSRMDLAHELAPIVLHPHVDELAISDSRSLKLMEQQAFWFAGMLLLPREDFSRAFYKGTLDEFLSLKTRWQVSVGAMIHPVPTMGSRVCKRTPRACGRNISRVPRFGAMATASDD